MTTDNGSGPFNLVVSSGGTMSGTFQNVNHEHAVIDAGIARDEQVATQTMTGSTVGGTTCDLTLTFGTSVTTSCHDKMFGDCSGGSISLAGDTLSMGAPNSAGGGHATWTHHDDTTVDGVNVTSTVTVMVSRP